MQTVVSIYKPIGKTPLDAVEQFKSVNPQYSNKRIGYAGRLDPMAHGVLLLLVEPETKKRNHYQNLDKEYEFKLVVGIKTDTHDAMGEIVNTSFSTTPKKKLNCILSNHKGLIEQTYPAYSSKTVDGKPLYWWTRNSKLNEITIPTKKVEILDIQIMKHYEKELKTLSNEVTQKVQSITGDFRQNKICAQWETVAKENVHQTVDIFDIRVHCSSGTYIRSLADTIGEELGKGAIAYDIKRTRVGDYTLEDSLQPFEE